MEMVNKKFSIVTTTINNPTLLDDYAKDCESSNYRNISFVVVGDKKTDRDAEGFVKSLSKKYPFEFKYFNPDDQDLFLKDYPKLLKFLPWNCVQRRNVGMLYAYDQGADVIITIDDDNFLAEPGYIEGHKNVGSNDKIPMLKTPSSWINICDYLEDKNKREFFARGYPISERKDSRVIKEENIKEKKIVVNGGLWLGDPDIDAITRLTNPIDVTKYIRNDNFALDNDMWCPFNSQNTAIAREAIPSYFLSPHIGRFDDIWGSYFLKRVADHFDHVVSFGFPLVKQERNDHNLWHDLDLELFGNQNTETFVGWLRSIQPIGETYYDASLNLLNELNKKLNEEHQLNDDEKNAFLKFFEGYKVWLSCFEK